MELPRSRLYETQGRKPTNNFLSLYSPAQQDPSTLGAFHETHDFLQPPEGNMFEEPPITKSQPPAVGHILPGGIGTYSISHLSCASQSQRMPKAEGVLFTAAESSGDKNHENSSFVGTLTSAKSSQDDEHQEFVIKKESSSHYKDTTRHDQKPNTPRSKHSATEQRRRSKINDRFLMLRELIPHGDQKRDKASFLLEVVEYIRFLQAKVHKYEDSSQGWTNKRSTMNPWNCKNNNNQRPTEGLTDLPLVRTGGYEPALVNAGNVSLDHPETGQTLLDSDLSSHEEIGQQPRLTNKRSPFPSGRVSTSVTASFPSTLAAESANTTSQLWQSGSYTNDCAVSGDNLKDQDATIESDKISISTIYSQGLLNTLTQALQNSGVDLSQANISVQVDLGKRANHGTVILKKNEVSAIDETLARSRLASTLEEKSDRSLKRFKTTRT